MNLNDYFDPIKVELKKEIFNSLKDQLFFNVKIHSHDSKIQGIEDVKIAVIGLNSFHEKENPDSLIGLQKVREYLYNLSAFNKTVQIYDLGNLKSGKTKNDQNIALRDVLIELITLNILPVVLGNSEDILLPNFLAYQKLDKKINLVSVDSRIRLSENRERDFKSALWKIIIENNGSLFSYYNIGYQTHFVNPKIIKFLSDQLHSAFRLGYIRNNLKEVEPIFRDADLIGLNISSVRQGDAFGQKEPSPNGYYGEEICQLSRYAGMSSKLTTFGIYDYDPKNDINYQTAHLIAQMIWYFIDGFLNRHEEYPMDPEGKFKKFIVNVDNMDHELIFYKSEKTNRWWIEVPSFKSKNQKQILISCTYDDYLEAGNGEIPQKWLKAYQKMN